MLDGVNDFVQVAHTPALDLAGEFTIEGWIRHTANSPEEPTIIGKRSGDNQNVAYVFYLKPDGRPAFKSRLAGTWSEVAASAILPSNTWHHVALTLGAGEARFYANGLPLHIAAFTATRPAVNAPVTIGASLIDARPAGNPVGAFPGTIDELSLYNRALSATEISDISSAGAGGKARFDLAQQFSVSVNSAAPGSASLPWVYGSMPPGTAMSPPADFVAHKVASMYQTGNYWGDRGNIGRNAGSTNVTLASILVLPGQVSLHPSGEGHRSVARWVAPDSGSYSVSATFTLADTTQRQKDIHVFQNTKSLLSSTVSTNGDGVAMTAPITVVAGDTVDFIVGPGNDGFDFDTTGLAATIVRITPSFGSWAASFGLTGPEALPDYDYDGDGQSNFSEWAFNSDPTVSGPAPQNGSLVNIGGQQWLALTYRRYADREAEGVTYTPEKSDGLGNWTTSGIINEVDPNAAVIPGATACRCLIPITLLGDGKQSEFLHVKAAKP